MARRQHYTESLTFLQHHFISKTRVRVTSLKNRRNAQPGRVFESSQRPLRPGVNDIDLPNEFFQSARNDVIVQSEGSHAAKDFIWQPHFPSRECCLNFGSRRGWPGQRTGHYVNFRARLY
jgi:hypothetical protein